MLANPFKAGDKVRYRAKDRRDGTIIWVACNPCSICGFKNQEHCNEPLQTKVCVKWNSNDHKRYIYHFTDLDFEIDDEITATKPLIIKAITTITKGNTDHRKIAETVIDLPEFEEIETAPEAEVEPEEKKDDDKVYTEDGAFSPAALASLASLELDALQEELRQLEEELKADKEEEEKAAKPKLYDTKSGDPAWITVRRRMERPV